MSGTALPNKSYRKIEKKHGVRGKYVLSRVLPWVGRGLVIGGLGLMIYGNEVGKKDIEKGSKYLGIGVITFLVSGYALDNHRRLNQMIKGFQKDKEEDERIREEIIKNNNLESTLSD